MVIPQPELTSTEEIKKGFGKRAQNEDRLPKSPYTCKLDDKVDIQWLKLNLLIPTEEKREGVNTRRG